MSDSRIPLDQTGSGQGQPDVLVTRGQFWYVDDLVNDVTIQDGVGIGETCSDTVGSVLFSELNFVRCSGVDNGFMNEPDVFEPDVFGTLYAPVEVSGDLNSVFFQGVTYYRPCGAACAGRHWLAGCSLQLNPCVFLVHFLRNCKWLQNSG